MKEKFTSGISVSAAKEKFGSGGGSMSVSETKEKFNVGGGGGGVSVSEAKEKFGKSNASSTAGVVTRRPPPVAPKPRPWSHVGADRRSGKNYF